MGIIEISEYLIGKYPELSPTFRKIGVVNLPDNNGVNVAEAISRIIIGQMLSRAAAQTIYSRVVDKSIKAGTEFCWRLTPYDLKNAGVSGRKTKAIIEFGKQYDRNPPAFEAWRQLDHAEIRLLVSGYWGLSKWSADMLSIFYFGLPDVFPMEDGTIKRAISLLDDHLPPNKSFTPDKAAPYRTYMALYLWKMIDKKVLPII